MRHSGITKLNFVHARTVQPQDTSYWHLIIWHEYVQIAVKLQDKTAEEHTFEETDEAK